MWALTVHFARGPTRKPPKRQRPRGRRTRFGMTLYRRGVIAWDRSSCSSFYRSWPRDADLSRGGLVLPARRLTCSRHRHPRLAAIVRLPSALVCPGQVAKSVLPSACAICRSRSTSCYSFLPSEAGEASAFGRAAAKTRRPSYGDGATVFGHTATDRQGRLSRTMALRVTMSFRTAAMMVTVGLFAGSLIQLFLEGFQGRIEPGGDLGGHEENVMGMGRPHPAAIEVVLRGQPRRERPGGWGRVPAARRAEWRPGPARRLAWEHSKRGGGGGDSLIVVG